MAIHIKDYQGNAEAVSSNAKGNLGVVLGAIGTGLGVLNSGTNIAGAANALNPLNLLRAAPLTNPMMAPVASPVAPMAAPMAPMAGGFYGYGCGPCGGRGYNYSKWGYNDCCDDDCCDDGCGYGYGRSNRCKVPMVKYYEDRIKDIKDVNKMFSCVKEDICNLRERASVSETTNAYQNLITAQAFGHVDGRFATERVMTGYEIDAKTCDFLKATKVLTPNNLATTYANPVMVLDQHEEFRYKIGDCNHRCHDQGYRGF